AEAEVEVEVEVEVEIEAKATHIPDPVSALPPVFSSVVDPSPSTPACPSRLSTDSDLACLENMDWGFIRSKIDDEPIRDVEGGRRLTYSDALEMMHEIHSSEPSATMDQTCQPNTEDPTQPLHE
ncbi:hypothetical protein HAX54_017315, partial [Datura stramonium]|nr:hypothetical protein [Datura stramonium]